MAVASIARPISPPSASISRTRWPFAVPPIAGLQGINATVSAESVQMPTRQPICAAAQAASHPACPAPTVTTSKSRALLANAERPEDMVQQVLGRATARDLLEREPGVAKIGQRQLLRRAARQRRAHGHHHVV